MENMNEEKRVAMEHAAMTNGSLRRLSALLKGMARDSTTSCFDTWRLEWKHFVYTEKLALKAKLLQERYAEGLHRLIGSLHRLIKGRAAEGLYNWRFRMKDSRQRQIQCQSGMKMLSNTFRHMLKGAVGVCLHAWQLSCRNHAATVVAMMRKNAAMKQLQGIMLRRLKGLVGVCVMTWHQSYDLEKFRDFLALRDDYSKVKAIQELSRI